MSIYTKIQTIKQRFSKLKIKKTGHNPYANFKYYELKDFMPYITEYCEEFQLFLMFNYTKDEAKMTIMDLEDNTTLDYVMPMDKASIKGCNEVQAIGGATTYLKRYLLTSAFDILENDIMDKMVKYPESKEYKCEQCGKTFQNTFYNGNNITAEQQYNHSLKRFGRALCKECRNG